MSSVSEVDALAASGRGYSEQLIERNPRQTRSSSLTWPIRQAPSGESPALPPGHAALASDGPSLAGADSAGAPGPRPLEDLARCARCLVRLRSPARSWPRTNAPAGTPSSCRANWRRRGACWRRAAPSAARTRRGTRPGH